MVREILFLCTILNFVLDQNEEKGEQIMKKHLLVFIIFITLLLTIATAVLAQSDTLEFIEEALEVRFWSELSELGEDYGVFTVGCECYGGIYGDLYIGKFAAKNAAVLVNEEGDNACALIFEPDAYDSVKAELTVRYGKPQISADDHNELIWACRQASVSLIYLHNGDVALFYRFPTSPIFSQLSFPPYQTTTVVPASAREPQRAEVTQENTFAFFEKASVADSWDTLLALMQQYGLHGYENGCYADIVGNLSIAGAPADAIMIICDGHDDTVMHENTGYNCDIWFEEEAYDSVKEALVKRYGNPEPIEDSDSFVWSFEKRKVFLESPNHGEISLSYHFQPTKDESKPSFPVSQPMADTPAPIREGITSSFDKGNFIAFMEKASLAYSSKALKKASVQYGLTMEENKYGARLSGDLAVAEYNTLYIDVCGSEDLPCFDFYGYFEPEAYDTVKALLTVHYGEPVRMWNNQDDLVWHFAQSDIFLRPNVAAMVEVKVDMLADANDFYNIFPPLLESVALGQTAQPNSPAQEKALDFMEQVLQTDTEEGFAELVKRYELTINKESGYKYIISNNISIDGCSSIASKVYNYDSTGFSTNIDFEIDSYDVVLETLVNRYGDPNTVWENSPALVWTFREGRVNFYRSPYYDYISLAYSPNEFPDPSLPSFPLSQE